MSDHCECEDPLLHDDDPEEFCWRCMRFVTDPEEDPDGR